MKLTWQLVYPPLPTGSIASGSQIPSSLTVNEAKELQRLATGKVCLEIGAAYGFSTITMALTAARVLSIDHHQTHSLEEFKENLKAYGVFGKVEILVGTAADIIWGMIGDGRASTFDMAFIDGGHDAANVRCDALNCLKMVKPNGLLVFHDYNEHYCPEVAPTLDELFHGKGRVVDTLFIYQKE